MLVVNVFLIYFQSIETLHARVTLGGIHGESKKSLVAKPLSRMRPRVTRWWYKPCCFSNINYSVIMLSRYWSLSQHGRIQPHSKSKAWQLSTQLRLTPIPHEFFLCLMFVTRRKTSFLILYWAQNLPSLLFLSTDNTLSTFLILAVCRTRVVIDLAHCRVSVAQW